MKVTMKKKYTYLIIAAIIVVIAVFGFMNRKGPGVPGNGVPVGVAGGGTVAISVETKKIVPETIEQYASISSKVLANNEVYVVPKVGGTVKKVHVNLGDSVKAGDILFEIDDTSLRLQVEQAAATLESALANYEMNVDANLENQLLQLQASVDSLEIQYNDLQKDLENTKALYEVGAASQKELDTLQSNTDKVKLQLDTARENLRLTREKIIEGTIKTGQAAITQAQVALSNAQTQLGYTKVKAEIDGVISSCNVTPGSTVSPQSPVMTIVNADKLKFSFNIPEDYINNISVGTQAYISVSAASDTPYVGTVTYISPAANSTTMLYPAEIHIDNVDSRIKPGMFASIRLVVDKRENIVSVPLNAVIEKGGEKFVYVVDENNTAHKRVVETGIQNDKNIEITKGISNGEKVVVVGQSFLSDGSTVNVTAEN